MILRKYLKTSIFAVILALSTASAASMAQQPSAAGDRSMAFRPGLGDAAREKVPGGRLVLLAYGAVIVLLGGYVAFIARRAARVDAEVQRLEDDLARRRPGVEGEG